MWFPRGRGILRVGHPTGEYYFGGGIFLAAVYNCALLAGEKGWILSRVIALIKQRGGFEPLRTTGFFKHGHFGVFRRGKAG